VESCANIHKNNDIQILVEEKLEKVNKNAVKQKKYYSWYAKNDYLCD